MDEPMAHRVVGGGLVLAEHAVGEPCGEGLCRVGVGVGQGRGVGRFEAHRVDSAGVEQAAAVAGRDHVERSAERRAKGGARRIEPETSEGPHIRHGALLTWVEVL